MLRTLRRGHGDGERGHGGRTAGAERGAERDSPEFGRRCGHESGGGAEPAAARGRLGHADGAGGERQGGEVGGAQLGADERLGGRRDRLDGGDRRVLVDCIRTVTAHSV